MYVDAIQGGMFNEVIKVVERVDGKRVFKEYPAIYQFYFTNPNGDCTTTYGTRVTKVNCKDLADFKKKKYKHEHKNLWESDIRPVAKCLSTEYLDAEIPKLHTCFFDIETDFDKVRGYSSTEEAFNKITAISCYLDWSNELIAYAIPPEGMTMEEAEREVEDLKGVTLFDSEEEMLSTFIGIIQDADVLSGGNSTTYDIPYMLHRVKWLFGETRMNEFCLWNEQPKKRVFEKYGAEQLTYDLVGRIHLDYMNLYEKYTYHEMHSYSLDAIAEYELGEKKVEYEGTLDQLYNNDFRKFVEYSLQDAMLLFRIDERNKFIDLANALAHANTVLIPTTMGAVAVTEQGIINEAHAQGLVVQNKAERNFNETEEEAEARAEANRAAGAYVAPPKRGIHEQIGSIDINSLYPSAIRALNMAPETLKGQLIPTMTDQMIADKMAPTMVKGKPKKGMSFAAAWEGVFGSLEYQAVMNQETDTMIQIEWFDGEISTNSAAEVYNMVFNTENFLCLSANGTLFDTEHEAIIPGLLRKWYAERKELQKKMYAATDPEEISFWDKRQHVKKINLNSLYGALLNQWCRFYDQRLGQSTTLTGRCITKHMSAYVNETLTGEYDHLGESIIYGDTDSVYFSGDKVLAKQIEAGDIHWTNSNVVELYDALSDSVNDSFPAFMAKAFKCPEELGAIIKGGREMVASRGLFIKKKRYALSIYDYEGKRLNTPKLKAMGLDLKRSDTPAKVQVFLGDILTDLLDGKSRESIVDKIVAFKTEFHNLQPWEKGTPKRVNNLTRYTHHEIHHGKSNMPGHVRAAWHWNSLKEFNGDQHSMGIVDGQKTIVCQLRPNSLGYERIGYPIDEKRLPEWFTELPFDDAAMEEAIVGKKVDNLLGILEWELRTATDITTAFNTFFTITK